MDPVALLVFSFTLLATFVIAWKGHRDAGRDADRHLAQQKLNRWLVGLSAGAAANSGFVVTGAVGLGYTAGLFWLLLPFGWFLGDMVFWKWFPHRINALGARSGAASVTDVIVDGLPIRRTHPLAVASTGAVILCLGGYTMAQWVAGQKFVEGAFGVSGRWVLGLFAAVIIAYTSLGRFRGSVYVDTFQALLRMIGTVVALGSALWIAFRDMDAFLARIHDAGPAFLSPLGEGTIASSVGFVAGYAAAALGFGLGQPHVTTRYMAASSPEEASAAKWIYIGYVQITWATMTVFGAILRGVMTGIDDPEQGLSLFVHKHLPPALVGLVVADIFGTIASTANGLIVAMAQSIWSPFNKETRPKMPFWALSLGIGGVTMLAAVVLGDEATVFVFAIMSVSLLASAVAPAVAIKALGWKHSALSLTAAVVAGFFGAAVWAIVGNARMVNVCVIGMPLGLLANYVVVSLGRAEKSGSKARGPTS